jgi:hypothetical protein
MAGDTTPKRDKKNLPSRHTTVGPARAPHRAFLYARGVTEQEVYQPLVGVATTWNEAAPCNITLSRQAQMVKQGVRAAGGTPREFTTITVTDGIAMGHSGMKASLVSREIIADSVELTMRGHCYDALVGLAGCDKSLPGLMMAMVRLNVPAVFMYGGSILPGRFQNRDVTIVDVFEGVGAHAAGTMSLERDEVRADDRPDRGAPDHGPDRRRAPLRGEEVRGRVARQQVRAVPEPDQDGPRQEERKAGGHDRADREERTDDADGVAEREPRPPATADHDRRQEAGTDRGPEHHRGAGGPGERGGPGELLGHDDRHRDRRDVARAAERDSRDQGPDRPPSDAFQLARIEAARAPGPIGEGGGHRPMVSPVVGAAPNRAARRIRRARGRGPRSARRRRPPRPSRRRQERRGPRPPIGRPLRVARTPIAPRPPRPAGRAR